jgi:hypothetical protein
MKRRLGATVLATLLFAACSGGNDSPGAEAVTDGAAPAAPAAMPDSMSGMDHSNMSGMDHSNMPGMNHDSMPGMDHSRMNMGPRSSGGTGASGAMAGMDHAQMGHTAPTASRGAQSPMDHSRMSGMVHPASRGARTGHGTGSMAGMDHSGMQHGDMNVPRMEGMTPPESAPALLAPGEGTDKLLALVRELVRDPAVQQQIRQDPALREAWADPGVREVILRP